MSALTSLLVRDKIVPVKKIEEAIQRQVISGGEMGTVLLELRAVAENVLNGYCAALYGLPAATREQVMRAPPEVLALVPREVAEGHRVIPIAVEGGTLVLAAAEPLGAEVEQQLGFLLRMEVSVRIVNETRVAAALAQHYGADLSSRERRLIDKLERREPGSIPKVDPPDTNVVVRAEAADVAPATPEPRVSYARPSAEMQASVVEANIAPEPVDPLLEPSGERVSRLSVPEPRTADVAQPAAPPAPARGEPRETRSSILARHRGPLTARHAVDLFAQAENRDDILQVFFAFSEQFFDYTALFVVHDDVAEGLEARGPGASTDEVRRIDVPLKVKGTFGAVYELQGARVGRLDIGPVDEEVRHSLGRDGAQPCAVLPVTIGKRVVLLLYGDRGGERFGVSDLPELLGMLPRVSDAFQQLILRRKIQGRAAATEAAATAEPRGQAGPDYPMAPEGPGRPSWGGSPVSAPPDATVGEAGALGSAGATEPADRAEVAGGEQGWGEAEPESLAADTEPPDEGVPDESVPDGAPGGLSSMEAAFHAASDPPPVSSGPVSEPPPPVASHAAPPSAIPPPPKRRSVALPGVPRTAPPPPVGGSAFVAPASVDDEAYARRSAESDSGIGSYSVAGASVDVVSARAPLSPGPRSEPPPRRVASEPPRRRSAPPPPSQPASDRPPASSRHDPRREGGGAVITTDVVRLGGVLGGVSDAITEPGATRPSVPSVDEPNVIVSLGPDIEALVSEVLASGPDEDAAIARVLSTGEAALPALVRQFPGPLWFDRHQPHRRLPRGRDLSSISRAIVALGDTSIPYLTPLLDHAYAEIRYYALLLSSEFHRADLAVPIGRLILDPDPGVRALAVELLRPYRRHHAEYTEALEHARAVARAPRKDIPTRAAAIWALGELRDERSLGLFVAMLETGDPILVETAHRALVSLTRHDLGPSARKWQAWAERHGREHRVEWLIEALGSADEGLRRVASDELKQITQEYYGYHHALPKREREIAQRKYRDWWEAEGRARFSS